MFEILVAQNKAEVWSFLCQKAGQDVVEFFINHEKNHQKNHQNQTKINWENWPLSNWRDLGNYIGSGQGGIFEVESQASAQNNAIVWDSPDLVLDDQSLKYLADQNNHLAQTVFIVILKSEINANLKKNIDKFQIKFQELPVIEPKIKQNLAKKYVTTNYPELISKLDGVVLNYLSGLDWPLGIIDIIDFLVLGEIESWSDFVRDTTKQAPNIFGFGLSINPTKNEIAILYELIQNLDQNQLLYTMLFSKLENIPILKTRLQELILADYKSKTISNQLLWAKYWLYGIII